METFEIDLNAYLYYDMATSPGSHKKLNKDGPHKLKYLNHYDTGLPEKDGQCGRFGLGVVLLEEVCHWLRSFKKPIPSSEPLSSCCL